MSMYRFSPIKTKETLLQAINHTHVACHTLCKQLLGQYLPVSGNVGIFCHDHDEYEFLSKLRREMTIESDNWNSKYFRLHDPIHIEAQGDVPTATYTHLYIRKPDETHPQVGDIDFYMEPEAFKKLKDSVQAGGMGTGLRTMDHRSDLNLVELSDPKIDALSYIGDHIL